MKTMRAAFVKQGVLRHHAKAPGFEELVSVPEAIRDAAVDDFVQAHKNLSERNHNEISANPSERQSRTSEFKFKSIQRDPQETFPVKSRNWNAAVAAVRKYEQGKALHEKNKDSEKGKNKTRKKGEPKLHDGFYNALLFELLKCATKKHALPETVAHTVNFTRSRLGKWKIGISVMNIPTTLSHHTHHDTSDPRHHVAAIDPGVRTFLTVYDLM